MNELIKKNDIDLCTMENTAHFKKGETILSIKDYTGRTGILKAGEAHISSFDEAGHETVMEFLSVGDSFGEFYIIPLENQEYYVIADSDCTILFLNFKRILSECNLHCSHHDDLIVAMVNMTAKRTQAQAMHLDVLSRRTTREKILTYLNYLRDLYSGSSFDLPMSLAALSSYLCVDRSAMMRELKKLNDEKVLVSSGRTFTLL